MHHRYDYSTGRITAMVAGPVVLGPGEAMVPAPDGTTDATHYVSDGAVVPRPAAPAIPETVTLEIGEDWAPAGIPAGTAVYVNGRDMGVWEGFIRFDAASDYALRFVPPFPQREAECAVVVE